MEKPYDNPIYKIASKLSGEDENVLSDVCECIVNTSDYFNSHKEDYENRGINYECKNEIIQWIGMVDSLLRNGYICECDYAEELDDVLACLGDLNGVKRHSLPLEQCWFDERDEITDWCEIIDQKWNPQGMCVAAIDIGSDSYVMFPCSPDHLDALFGYANEAGFLIDQAYRM